MKTLSVVTLIVILFSFYQGFSRGSSLTYKNYESIKDSSEQYKLGLKVAYFGELVLHPGLTVGVECFKEKNSWINFYWNAEVGGFWHRWNNTSLFVKTGGSARFQRRKVFADFNIGIGYMHSFLAGEIYNWSEQHKVETKKDWGSAHFMPNTSLLLGWKGGKKRARSWAVYLGPEFYLQSNFNHIYLPHLAAKMGVTYKLK